MRLAYLRPEDIPYAKERILATSAEIIVQNPNLNNFVAYFDSEWMTKIPVWNIFDVTDHTTNNDLEGWHFGILQRLVKNNKALKFWKFVEEIGKEALIVQEEISQLERGMELSRRSLHSVTTDHTRARLRALYSTNSFIPGGTLNQQIDTYMRGLQ